MASEQTIGKISAFLGLALGHAIPPASLPIWKEILSPIPDALAEQAAMEVVRKTTACFPPAPGAVYQMALDIIREELPSPGAAWAVLGVALDAVANKGGWNVFYKLPESIKEAARQVGLRGMVNGNHLMSDRARFLEFYRVIIDQQAEARLALPASTRDALTEGENE